MSEDRFQIGDYYLSRHKNSPIWKATWYDSHARQTKRISLGAEDLQEAKFRLAEFVTKNVVIKNQAPADIALATILVRYWNCHAKNLPSHEAANYGLGRWTEFWGDATVADLTVPRQKEFMAWLKIKGFSNSYVSRVMAVGRAAIRMAWKHGEITSVPFIIDERDRSDAKQYRRLDKEEMRLFLATIQRWPHLYAYTIIALNTLARPEAILDLAPAQVRLDDRHIHLNPKGRKQTKKYRPIVPITDTLLPFVQRRDVTKFVNWHGAPIDSIKKGFKTVIRAAGLPDEISPYSLRHTMAVELRKRSVPAWEVEGLLGHRRPGVTETYAEYSPDYLSKGREAIDNYFKDLGVSLPVPEMLRVSAACQPQKTEEPKEGVFAKVVKGLDGGRDRD
ncbi:site-specific integrase [Mesorhizobium sp. WSM3626]|uniref:tyrosine-type recombinase/integrase n=1 Tax=Mesorhizobium sp. WSM3626 TaxID=1040987 RepID=UPI0004865F7D|nr:site-specific integrase [Mesorhizobium sp. WSM3626]